MKKTVIISAGGIGKRMNADIPKQFLNINDRPIIFHTIELFHRFDSEMQIIVVLPSDYFQFFKDLVEEFELKIPVEIVEGGEERFHSIRNGLNVAVGDLIAVHDAVRPLVSQKVVKDVFESAAKFGAAIPVIPLKESIRELIDEGSRAVKRNNFRIVQTPQIFKAEILKTAYQQNYQPDFTDDASVVESKGHKIHLIEGNFENIKITTPEDLKIAECLMK